MSNGGNLLDGLKGLFSSGGGGRDVEGRDRDPDRERLERVEQLAAGVDKAAAALDDEMGELRRESREATEAVLERARALAPRRGGENDGSDDDGAERSGAGESARELDRCVDALEDLHYRLVRIEVHPELQGDEEGRGRAREEARESVETARELARSLSGATAS